MPNRKEPRACLKNLYSLLDLNLRSTPACEFNWNAAGAIVGAWCAPLLGASLGRRPTYFLLCLASFVLCAALFHFVHAFAGIFLAMSFLVGAATASFYGWFPLYFPELFPTRVRATGQGLCYNSGRIFAAIGALTQGQLVPARIVMAVATLILAFTAALVSKASKR